MCKKIDTKQGEIEYFMTHAGIPPFWSKDDLDKKIRRTKQEPIW